MKVAYTPVVPWHGGQRIWYLSRSGVQTPGYNLKEIEDWNCCGATAAHSLNHELTISLMHVIWL